MQVVLVDHYDSFTFNVLDWLAAGEDGFNVTYVAYDDMPRMAALVRDPRYPLIISPGPRRPNDAPRTLELLASSLGRVPILGVCLGHQMLAHIAGAKIIRSHEPMHGTTRTIRVLHPNGLLAPPLPPTFKAATYNSLVVDDQSLPQGWQVSARCEQGEVQALAYEPKGQAPAYGVQFHPESFLSEGAALLRQNLRKIFQTSATAPLSAPS